MDYIAVAAAPGIAICIYIFYRDIYNKEPKLNLAISFALGALAILPAIELERYFSKDLIDGSIGAVAIFAFLVVGLSEEFCKFVGLRWYSYTQKSFDEPFDGIVYSLMISMGFATVENIMYVTKYEAAMGNGLQIGLQRMFLSIPAHATFAVIMGYFVGKAKFDSKNSFILTLIGLGVATFFHGLYDFFLFVNQFAYAGQNIAGIGKSLSEFLLLAGAIISLIVALALSRRLIRVQRDTSFRMFNNKNSDTGV